MGPKTGKGTIGRGQGNFTPGKKRWATKHFLIAPETSVNSMVRRAAESKIDKTDPRGILMEANRKRGVKNSSG